MSWAATALCSLSWAGVLSLFATSSSVNPQLMSLFPALLFKKFLRALQQVTAERVRDEKSMGPIWGSQSLELWKWKHLEQAGAAGGEVKTDWWLTGRCLSRTPCANLSVFFVLFTCFHHFGPQVWCRHAPVASVQFWLASAEVHVCLSSLRPLSVPAWKVMESSCKGGSS